MRQRLAELSRADPPVEQCFCLGDPWSLRLFVALLRRYAIKPYRLFAPAIHHGDGPHPPGFLNETLWPEFQELNATLVSYLDEVTTRVVSQGVHADRSEASVVAELGMGTAITNSPG